MVPLPRLEPRKYASDEFPAITNIVLPPKTYASRAGKILIAASVVLFLVSLTQTGFYLGEEERDDSPGWLIILIGWLAVFTHDSVAWLANPLLLLTWFAALIVGSRRAAIVLAAASTLLALSFLFCESMSLGPRPKVITLGPGYWIWLASIAVALVASMMPRKTQT
jgi:hypothetical protein